MTEQIKSMEGLNGSYFAEEKVGISLQRMAGLSNHLRDTNVLSSIYFTARVSSLGIIIEGLHDGKAICYETPWLVIDAWKYNGWPEIIDCIKHQYAQMGVK